MSKQTRSYENECYQNNESENTSSEKCGIFYAQNLIEIKQLFFVFVNSSKSDKKTKPGKFYVLVSPYNISLYSYKNSRFGKLVISIHHSA